jgi:hypothetical protein
MSSGKFDEQIQLSYDARGKLIAGVRRGNLLDFARIMEIFEAKQVSFVSITQSFSTATSMGRPAFARAVGPA